MVTTTTTVDGTTTSYSYTAGSSGIDTSALVEAAVEAKMAPAYTLESKISDNEAKIEAYSEMQSLLSDLQDTMQALRSPQSVSEEDDDVFAQRAAYLTTDDGSDASDYMDVTVDSGTETGTYTIEILQVAEAHKVAAESVEDSTAELGLDGTFTLGLDGGDTVSIAVTEDMTLEDLADAINAEADTSGVKASIIQVSDSEYTLVLTATETGKDIVTSSTDGDDILAGLGVTDEDGAFATVLNEAQDAIIEVEGITITRDSNQIDDVLDGITINLYAAAEDTTITIEVSEDLSAVLDAVTAFIDAYNAWRDFVITNQSLTTSGTASDDAVLFADSTLRSATLDITTLLSSSHADVSLRDLGIEFDENNYLTYDEDDLSDAVLNNLDAIEDLFAFQMTSSSSDLGIIASPESLGDAEFTVEIEVDADGNITSASINGDSSLVTVSGSRIKGAEGSIYEGMTLVYTGTSSQTISVSTSQGIADQLYYAIDSYADATEGSLAELMADLEDQNEDWEADIATITERAENYRTLLEARYAAMEAAYESAQLLIAQLEAYSNADDD